MKNKKNTEINEKSIDILNEEKINGKTIKGGGFRFQNGETDRNNRSGGGGGQTGSGG